MRQSSLSLLFLVPSLIFSLAWLANADNVDQKIYDFNAAGAREFHLTEVDANVLRFTALFVQNGTEQCLTDQRADNSFFISYGKDETCKVNLQWTIDFFFWVQDGVVNYIPHNNGSIKVDITDAIATLASSDKNKFPACRVNNIQDDKSFATNFRMTVGSAKCFARIQFNEKYNVTEPKAGGSGGGWAWWAYALIAVIVLIVIGVGGAVGYRFFNKRT